MDVKSSIRCSSPGIEILMLPPAAKQSLKTILVLGNEIIGRQVEDGKGFIAPKARERLHAAFHGKTQKTLPSKTTNSEPVPWRSARERQLLRSSHVESERSDGRSLSHIARELQREEEGMRKRGEEGDNDEKAVALPCNASGSLHPQPGKALSKTKTCTRQSLTKAAEDWLKSAHEITSRSVCIDLGAINVAKQILEAERVHENKAAINEFVYGKLIKGYCLFGLHKDVFSLLEVMDQEGVKRDVVIYNILLESEQNPERACVLLQELKERGISPNERTYSAAIRCFGRAGELGSVRHLWAEMCSTGVVPSVFTFNSLIDAYANVGDVRSCNEIINEMKLQLLNPDRESYNTLLKAYSRSRDAVGAVSALRSISRAGIQSCITTYNTVMDACVRGGDMLRALHLSKELDFHGLKPDTTTFATLMRAAGFLRDAKLVLKVLSDMKKSKCQHNEVTYRCAVYAFVRCGEGGKALKLLEKMSMEGFAPAMTVPEVLIKSVDSALFRECTEAAMAGRLHEFLSNLTSSGLVPTRETGCAIVRKLAHSQGVSVAPEVAKEFFRIGIGPLGLSTWQSVIGVLNAQAEHSPILAAAEVDNILKMMEIEGTSPNRAIFEAAISIYVKSGDGGKAIKMYESLQSSNIPEEAKKNSKHLIERMMLDSMDAALLSAITANIGGHDEENTLVENMPMEGCHSKRSMESIMQDLAKAGIKMKPKAVTRVIRQLCVEYPQQGLVKNEVKMRKPIHRRAILSENHNIMVQARRLQRLERAMGLVETSACLFGMEVTNFLYGALMEACIKLKQEERVELLWEKMRVEGVSPDLSTWMLRIKAMTSTGLLKGQAHDLLAEAAGDGLELDTSLLRVLLKACHQVKDKLGVFHVRRMLMTKNRIGQ